MDTKWAKNDKALFVKAIHICGSNIGLTQFASVIHGCRDVKESKIFFLVHLSHQGALLIKAILLRQMCKNIVKRFILLSFVNWHFLFFKETCHIDACMLIEQFNIYNTFPLPGT